MRQTRKAITILLAVLMILGMASPVFASDYDYAEIETLSEEYHPFTDVRYSA